MNIRLSYDMDFESFRSLFKEVEVFDWERDKDEQIDLLIFPGGEDVQLEWYMEKDMAEKFHDLCYFNKKRDEYEKKIFDAMMDGTLKVNKVLGICRGIQFINTMFGGYLYPDLHTFHIAHGHMHDIIHVFKSNLGFIKTVNSYHHQGVKVPGSVYKNKNVNPKIIAVDTNGAVREIITWMSGRILGVQYHPEYYAECLDKKRFRNFIKSWVDGEVNIYDEVNKWQP